MKRAVGYGLRPVPEFSLSSRFEGCGWLSRKLAQAVWRGRDSGEHSENGTCITWFMLSMLETMEGYLSRTSLSLLLSPSSLTLNAFISLSIIFYYSAHFLAYIPCSISRPASSISCRAAPSIRLRSKKTSSRLFASSKRT